MTNGLVTDIAISVVIPTRNRRTLLGELVESLSHQTLSLRLFEVIVVDNCSDDGTAEMMSELAKRYPFRIVYVRNGTNRGQIYSRNAGCRLARAPIVAFTDSDCRVSPDWLDRILSGFASDEIGLVSGPVRDKPEQPVTFFSLPTFANEGENVTYPACNIAYRADAFWKVGGFEDVWPGDIGEKSFGDSDTDLAWRVKHLGYASQYVPDALVYHQVWQLTIRQWILAQLLAWRIPGVLQRTPHLKPKLRWWGPFLYRDNFFFYLAIAGTMLSFAVSPWAAALAIPHFWQAAYSPGRRFSVTRAPRIAARILFMTLRQALMCAALCYGSLRARTLAL